MGDCAIALAACLVFKRRFIFITLCVMEESWIGPFLLQDVHSVEEENESRVCVCVRERERYIYIYIYSCSDFISKGAEVDQSFADPSGRAV